MISLPLPRAAAVASETEPIRAEIFGVERFEQHARSLAEAQLAATGKRRGYPLLARLEQNSRVLRASYHALTEAVRRDEAISPAAEWLIDNFFLVDDQVRIIRDALPADYYRELPKILSGHLADHPRVYGLTWAFVAHTDSRFDANLLARFVRAYQEITPLTMGELWALPITLRLALVENLRRIAVQLVRSREARAEANELADRLLEASGGDPDDDLEALEPYATQSLDSPFVVALVQRLRESDPAVIPALGWLEERLAEDGTTSEEIVRREHMSQLAAHATIVNVFTTLRHIGSYDWREFFENVSLVERALRRDPTRIYPQMDFTTRDTYRHAVEELARGSKLSELAVAERVLEKATRQSDRGEGAEARRHPGYWLIRDGRRELEKELGYRAPMSAWLRRAFLAAATPGYLGTIALVSALLVALLLVYLAQLGVGVAVLAALAVLSLVPASDLAIALVQRDVIELLEPRRLPKLDFRSGIPESCSTLVVVPTILTDVEGVLQQVERLERHYLATARGHIAYALLSDWKDADAEELPGDDNLLAVAARGLSELNERYGSRPDGGPRFLLLHRRRVWNPAEGVWMGWERKRGKIDELNRLLRGDRDTTYIPRADGLTDVPANVRYVLTLDADTRLPLETGEKLVGAMAHPLNRPWLDPVKRRVTRGYGILQPRVTPILPPADEMTLYHRIYSGPTGLDPYVAAVSDVYQDLFNEASYVGKGIYDVDAFAAALEDRVPENTLLSHDLFEGAFARTGLITDVEVFDEFPTHYETNARRVHRWARGDWQLLPWILGRPPSVDGRRAPRALSLISRWKMIDNLRRTLSPPSTFLLLVAGWVLLPVSPLLWTGFVVATIAMPAAVPVLTGLVPRRRGIAKRSHLRGIAADAVTAAAQVGLSVLFVANRAVLMIDAIVRTLYRVYSSRRQLLEWVTAAQAGRGVSQSLGQAYQKMWSPAALGLAVLALLLVVRPMGALEAFPVVALWLASPAFALWLSRPLGDRGLEELDDESEAALRRLARQTWGFFERLVNEDSGWLPPDNLQTGPETVVAHRTSPTNIGMYLISTVAARDFGWIGTEEVAIRLERTFGTLDRLERHAGHLYNWYDTRTLLPLEPRYVSTVDSGNLAGHLLTVAQACRGLAHKPVLEHAALTGIGDAVVLAREAARVTSERLRSATISRHELDESIQALAEALAEEPTTSAAWAALLERMETAAATLCDVAEVLAEENGEGASELMTWADRVADGVASHRRDLLAVAPWGELLAGDIPAWLSADPGRRERWERAFEVLAIVPAPVAVNLVSRTAETELDALAADLEDSGDLEVEAARRWVESLRAAVRKGRESAAGLVERLPDLAARADGWVEEIDFRILYDDERELFSIGYRPLEGRLDSGYYDLLATEARLASLVAIAKGDVPVEHWFRLGRPVTPVGKDAALISWSGSMFEYLMPYLVMKAPSGTLLDRTQRLVVRRQIQYGSERGIPWGVSESAYNARDLAFTYQYSHFGIPGLGLTRGLSEDLVVAPYATALAAMIEPRAAVRNLERLAALDARGDFGFYEALDFTPIRLPKDREVEVVRAYMAHHQGMTIAAIDNVVNDGVLRKRFHEVPMIGAAELVLQERIPRDMAVARPRPEEVKAVRHVREIVPPAVRRFRKPHTRVPRTHILSNGRYSVMLTNAGSGYSRHLGRAVTRWREDTTRDGWGSYLYLRDVAGGEVWSAGYQPTAVDPEHYEVLFSEDRAETHRLDGAIWTSLEVIVSPEDDGELRRLTIKNLGARPREIEVTSYAEVVLAPPADDDAHPAFQNLFVRTEFVPTLDAIIGTRRPRESDDPQIWAAHVMAVRGGETVGALQCETDRARFLDRGRGVRRPSVVFDGRPLSNTTGSVLDPVFSLRRTVRLQSGESARLTFSTLVADSRDQALALVDKYREAATFEREAALAWTQAQVQLQHLGIEADEAHLFQRLASRILYLDPGLRPVSASLFGNAAGQEALWGYGISGDRPVVVVRIDHIRDREIVRHLIRAHEYWGMKGLTVDLVIVNEHPQSYAEELQDWLERRVRVSQSSARHEIHAGHGEIFILRADQVPEEDQLLLRAVARAVLLSHHGSLAEQLEAALRDEPETPPGKMPARQPTIGLPPPRPRLSFFNGLGGFADAGREYVTILGEGQWTPAPWINVISNPRFGFQVSESGAGFTWAVNSRENRLTPWSNDPVTDPVSEALYIRDEDSGAIWTPTPLPIRQPSPYQIHHGQGYSRFELQCHEIASRLTQYVPLDDPVKISRLTLRNLSERTRRLSVTAYVEWVLGVFREKSAPFVVTTIDEETRSLFAWNRWNPVYAERVAFADLSGQQDEWTADRTEFLGRNGTLRYPAAMVSDKPLSGRTGTGWDPCGALRRYVTLRPGATVEVVFLLGQGDDLEASRRLVARYRTADLDAVLEEVETWWEDVLGALQVRTPDYSMSIMLNRWLLYQALSCRYWARSAFYQSGGAYGFRDQLQDVSALVAARREIVREHILRAAAHQFVEGDVLHWWHPPTGKGVRTTISDDRSWLPLTVLHYLAVTGDVDILDEEVAFLTGEKLEEGEHEKLFVPEMSEETGSLYEHCARALDVSLGLGPHDLPLIGTGDWNDGMNRVGEGGRGESVWLAWFLLLNLRGFLKIAERRGDTARVEQWRAFADRVREALEEHGWDGDWYRRAFFDDGTPIGSSSNEECRIDSIAQSWAVLSGAAPRDRAAHAMQAVEQYLVRRGDGLVLLFTPPFDRTPLDPGYIKGYVPGIRENGGQYTHAAIWSVIAFAELGDGDKATELFSILNPINHASTRAGIYRYKVEPYVAVADVYAESPHVGRGGWTWYTGSAGWMYRAGVEWILGFRLRGESLVLDPCIPRDWTGYEISFRYHSARYEIEVQNPEGVMRGIRRVELDGEEVPDRGWGEVALAAEEPGAEGVEVGAGVGGGSEGGNPSADRSGNPSPEAERASGARIPLVDDGRTHSIRVMLG